MLSFFSPCLPFDVCTACVQTIPPNPLTKHTHATRMHTVTSCGIFNVLWPWLQELVLFGDGAIYVSSYYYMCVLILLYVSSYCCICVLMLLHEFAHLSYSACCGGLLYVSSYYYICPHTTIYVSSHYYMCVLILLQWLLW
jgi:hypothetical protein